MIKNISMKYPGFELDIKELNLDHNVTCIVGHVGSGKTTLLRTIASLIEGEFEGEIETFLKHDAELLPRMSLREYVELVDMFTYEYNIEMLHTHLEDFGFVLDKKLQEHSKGQLDIITILVALSAQTEYILLDEPFTRVDPLNRSKLVDIIVDMIHDQKFIITSHELHTLERLYDYVVLLKDGKCIVQNTFMDIQKEFSNIKNWYQTNYTK